MTYKKVKNGFLNLQNIGKEYAMATDTQEARDRLIEDFKTVGNALFVVEERKAEKKRFVNIQKSRA